MINLESLLRIPHVDVDEHFDISPDGTAIAFAWNLSGRWELYTTIIDRPGTYQLVSPGLGSRFNPKFSPITPNLLACTADFDGSESYHLLLCDLANNSSVDLTPDDSIQPRFSWSSDGKHIAFISSRSGCFDLYIINLDTQQVNLAYAVGHPIMDVTWSPDGLLLAVTAETSGQEYGIQLVEVNSGKALIFSIGDQPLNAKDPCWSQDGKQLVFCGAHDDFDQVGLFDLGAKQFSWLTDACGNNSSPTWDARDERLVYLQQVGATNQIVIQHLTTNIPDITFSIPFGIHTFPRFTPNGRNLYFIFENPQNPPDLWNYSFEHSHPEQITNSLPSEINKNELPMPIEIFYPGLDEGITVPALLFQSKKSAAPGIVNIHGGPNWHYSFSWYPLMTHLASRGWVVLAPNYRGSTGYGTKWQTANRFDMGGCDTRDVTAGALYLLREGLVDPMQIAVTGRSHGGYLTMTCLTQYPEIWAAGSGEAPFFNWFTSHNASREDLKHWNIENMGDPIENEARWRRLSPYFYLDHVRAPVQIICGGLDPRCPAVDAIAARDSLFALGKEVEFMLFSDEGHVFLQLKNIIAAETSRVDFLARHLRSLETPKL